MSLLVISARSLTMTGATKVAIPKSHKMLHWGGGRWGSQWILSLQSKQIYFKNIYFECLAIHEREH